MTTEITVLLPNNPKFYPKDEGAPADVKFPTLYLLHGLSDDHTMWLRHTSIERYASERGLAVVMPAVYRGFYTDMKMGYNYWTFISEELPAIAQAYFPLSTAREHNFAAGLSMGGYGAFKLALRCPDRFAAGASLSGALDMANYVFDEREYPLVFGSVEDTKGSKDDLLHLAAEVANSDGPKPKLYQYCGTEDFLYGDNLSFLKQARKLSLDLTYEEESGDHQWKYWDRKIQDVLEWLPL